MSFEDFLREQHDKQYHGTNDDAPDDYERWLTELEGEDWIVLGDKYGFNVQQGKAYVQ